MCRRGKTSLTALWFGLYEHAFCSFTQTYSAVYASKFCRSQSSKQVEHVYETSQFPGEGSLVVNELRLCCKNRERGAKLATPSSADLRCNTNARRASRIISSRCLDVRGMCASISVQHQLECRHELSLLQKLTAAMSLTRLPILFTRASTQENKR